MDRSIPLALGIENFTEGRAVKGRPIGLLALWLQRGDPEDLECCETKDSHHKLKRRLCTPEFFQARKDARAALWALRVEFPRIERLFELEAPVPDHLLGGVDPQLWEPERVF